MREVTSLSAAVRVLAVLEFGLPKASYIHKRLFCWREMPPATACNRRQQLYNHNVRVADVAGDASCRLKLIPEELFPAQITGYQRDLGTGKNRARVAHGSVFSSREGDIHFLGSRLCNAHSQPSAQRDVA